MEARGWILPLRAYVRECIDGRQASVDVLGVGAVVGFGAMLGVDVGLVSFEDDLDSIEPDAFEGYFGYTSTTATVVFGLGAYAIGLGGNGLHTSMKAYSFGAGFTLGLGLGATALAGWSELVDVAWEDCECP